MMFSSDESKAIVAALGAARADGERNQNMALAKGDKNGASLAGMFAAECAKLSKRFQAAHASLTFLTQGDGEIINAALRARANFWRARAEQCDKVTEAHERSRQLAFAAAFNILADRIEREIGRAPAVKH